MEIVFFSLEFWLIIAIVFIIGELLTLTFFLLSVGIGAALAGLTNYLGFSWEVQLVVFVVATLVCVGISRPIAKKLTKNAPDKKSNSDRLIGEEAIVTEDIELDKMGTVKILGDTWKAIAKENISAGEKVIVKNIDGVKLIVERKSD